MVSFGKLFDKKKDKDKKKEEACENSSGSNSAGSGRSCQDIRASDYQVEEKEKQSKVKPPATKEDRRKRQIAKFSEKMARILSKVKFYHGLVPKSELEETFKGARPGDFIIRKNERPTTARVSYVLSVWTAHPGGSGSLEHYEIYFTVSKGWRMRTKEKSDPLIYKSIFSELIHYYHTSQQRFGLGSVLVRPLKRPDFHVLRDDVYFDADEKGNLIKLGEGAYGKVYKGKFKDGDEKHAIAIKEPKMGSPGDLKKMLGPFFEECRVMVQLKHANIIKLYGVCVETTPLLIITEFASGGSMRHFCEKNTVNTTLLAKFACDVACGMAFIAEKNIVHRDLAARNVLVVDGDKAKVSDFGLSKLLVGGEAKIHTNESMPLRWGAPETMVEEGRIYTERSDVWSFGITMWEFGTRCKEEVPFKGYDNEGAKSWKEHIKNGTNDVDPFTQDDSKAARSQRANFPAFFRHAMKKCLARNPSGRPTFVALSGFLNSEYEILKAQK